MEFKIGEVVICIDASDLPPQWLPLEVGKMYIVRDVDIIPEDGNFNANIHKKTKYLLRLEGVVNTINSNFGKERGYAESRFEKYTPKKERASTRETLSIET